MNNKFENEKNSPTKHNSDQKVQPIKFMAAKPTERHHSDPQLQTIRLNESFDLSSSSSTGGVTGSRRVPTKSDEFNSSESLKEPTYYQLKPSILDNKFSRRLKAGDTDRENFGEFIASCIGQSMFASAIPQVVLVYDADRKRTLVASKYLKSDEGEVKTLDNYIKDHNDLPPEKSHARFVVGNQAQGGNIGLDVPYMQPMKSSLMDAIALSSVLGDHDINPGNMMVLNKLVDGEMKPQAVRIDLGHAFNDLLNAPAIMGGTVLNPEHPVMDFINREKIAGLDAPSKLWRDYPGICSLEEMKLMAESLKKIENVDARLIKDGVQNAQDAFWLLIKDMKANKDWKGIEHVHKSLIEIHNNISSEKIKPACKSKEIEQQINQVFTKCAEFVIKNCEDAKYTASLMKLQSNAYKLLKEGASTNDILGELQRKANKLGINMDKTTWIKNNADTPPFEGNFRQLVIRSKIQILCEQSEDCKINKIANNILAFMDGYKEDIRSQRIGNSKGLKKLEQIEPVLDDILDNLTNNKLKDAIVLVNNLKKDLINNFGEKNLIGKSHALQAITQIELDLKREQMSRFRSSNNEIRNKFDDSSLPENDHKITFD